MSVKIFVGDAIAQLQTLPSDSVHCIVTSPPYWGLRDYGTGMWEGGEPGCDHLNGPLASSKSRLQGHTGDHVKLATGGMPFKDLCGKCGARRIDQQIGLEETPELWAAKLVEVFREVRRVLRSDGVCFVNVGDSYVASTKGAGGNGKQHTNVGSIFDDRRSAIPLGLKPKDLIGQPWLLAFALRADGWWLRGEIIWSKPNPMPESVTDRPTKAHEQVFLLTKSSRYFYDAEAVREAHVGDPTTTRGSWRLEIAAKVFNGGMDETYRNPAGRNLRSVWTIATEPWPEAHFATFPSELARRCILAGTSAKGCCPACGAPWERVVERTSENLSNAAKAGTIINGKGHVSSQVREGHDIRSGPCLTSQTLGWLPTCACDAGHPVPATVLDPFGGSGTTGLVADRLGRDAVLIELSRQYCEMIRKRLDREKARRALGDVERVKPIVGQLSLFT
jgi:DNA modification methylase